MNIYQSFDPHTYLNEYYRTVAHDSLEMLRFLVAGFAETPPGGRALDFGGGPTLFTAIAAAARASEIHLSDYSPANRAAVWAWLQAEPEAFVWRDFVETVLRLEGGPADAAAITARKALVRAKLTSVLACDVTQYPALSIVPDFARPQASSASEYYDLLCTSMCLEAVAQDAAEWQRYLGNVTALLRPGGRLLMITVRRGRAYPVGAQLFSIASIDESDIRAGLLATGFEPHSIQMALAPSDHPEHSYDGLILTSALKANQAHAA